MGIATRFILQEGNEFPNDGGDEGTQQSTENSIADWIKKSIV